MNHNRVIYIAHAGIIAAIYVVLTALAAGFNLASGAIQVRFSEALTILPFFTPAAIPGLTIGCLLSNTHYSFCTSVRVSHSRQYSFLHAYCGSG